MHFYVMCVLRVRVLPLFSLLQGTWEDYRRLKNLIYTICHTLSPNQFSILKVKSTSRPLFFQIRNRIAYLQNKATLVFFFTPPVDKTLFISDN